jgi:uncharacterized alpha-E superfamily protein
MCDTAQHALETLLEVADSIMTYRARYRTTFQPAPVLDLLLLDESNPRSVAFQLEALAAHFEHLPRAAAEPSGGNAAGIMHGLLAELRLADIADLSRKSRLGDRPGLESLLGSVTGELARLTPAIARTYFSHADDGRTVSATGAVPR